MDENKNGNGNQISIMTFMLILAMGFMLMTLVAQGMKTREKITFQKFNNLIENQLILNPVVIVDKQIIKGFYLNESYLESQKGTENKNQLESKSINRSNKIPFEFSTDLDVDKDILTKLKEKGVDFTFDKSVNYGGILSFIFPLILFFFIFSILRRSMGGGLGGKNNSGGFGGFGGGGYKKYTPNSLNISFQDVAGAEEAKEEIKEIVDYLKDPIRFKKLGAKIPKGALLVGPPGTGKTLLAKAIACEANVPYYYSSGSEFVEVFVGMGARRIRNLFEEARKNAPCIIFIDEIDAVGGKRDGLATGGHSEKEQTLNQLLTEMDGFEPEQGVIVLAATNRPEVLDGALKRPGRFNREITVGKPNLKGRIEILKVHSQKRRKVPMADDVNLEVVAKGTTGFTGAELENLINEAALLAGRQNKDKVEMIDFENAIDKILMGLENRNLVISDEEKRKTAIHEAGHTLISLLSKNLDKVHKVSIIPRGRALGVTQTLPEEEATLNYSKSKCLEMIQMLMGGRVAEEIFYNNEKTTGASNDIEKATHIARNMVYSWGMSDEMGFLNYNNQPQHQFDTSSTFSESIRMKADECVKKFIDDSYQNATKILMENKDKLKEIADLLMEKETITSEDLKEIIKD